MIGHLDPEGRQALWARLAARLAPGAPLVVGLQPPDQATAVPRTRFTTAEVGELTYEGWGQAEPTGPESVRWTMQYRTLDGERILSERTADYGWWILSAPAALAELAAAGLAAAAGLGGLIVARREAYSDPPVVGEVGARAASAGTPGRRGADRPASPNARPAPDVDWAAETMALELAHDVWTPVWAAVAGWLTPRPADRAVDMGAGAGGMTVALGRRLGVTGA